MTLFRDIKAAAQRSQYTLLQDTVGAAALCFLLIAMLHVPNFI